MSWQFNHKIADIFPVHARQHIPNYNLVIDKSIEICKTKPIDSSIIDVGCATGETLIRLHQSGFTNLHGVDSSPDMLVKCPQDIATYYQSDQLPNRKFDIIIMNWTLHFIKDKINYLQSIYDHLSTNGILILTDKTSTDDFPKKFYYDYKKDHGVSEQEILQKEISLEGVMHVNDIGWYMDLFEKVGFKKSYIFDAHWCFTSWVCLKK